MANTSTTSSQKRMRGKRSLQQQQQQQQETQQQQQQHNTTMASVSDNPTTMYSPSSVLGGAAVKRTRTPHSHDVLSGRGGGINGHPGNIQFRDWVRVRKNDYNLAPNKSEKARVAKEVIMQVKNQVPPGRFLQRDPGSVGSNCWWTEIDDEKIMAKTSQALREGAPQIRAAHQGELMHNKEREHLLHPQKKPSHPKRSRARSKEGKAATGSHVPDVHAVAPPPTTTTTIAPGSSGVLPTGLLPMQSHRQATVVSPHLTAMAAVPLVNKEENRPAKRVRVNYNGQAVRPNDDTPPLMPAPHPNTATAGGVPPLEDGMPMVMLPPPVAAAATQKEGRGENSPSTIRRTHSLACSETSMGEFLPMEEFVNPFEDESDLQPQQQQQQQPRRENYSTLDAPNPVISTRDTSSSVSDSSTTGAGGSGGGGGLQHLSPPPPSSSSMEPTPFRPTNNNYNNNTNNSNIGTSTAAGTINNYNCSNAEQPGVRSRNSANNLSSRSLTSILSDLDLPFREPNLVVASDFQEGMKEIYDALHPSYDGEEATTPTFLYPYRGGAIFNSRRPSGLASRGMDGRQ